MNLESKQFQVVQVDVQKYECHQFEQLLDDCLDGRGSPSALASNSHLQQCGDCQNAYDVYLQFDHAGGALLNGGSRSGGQLSQQPRSKRDGLNIWSKTGAAVLTTSAAVLMLFGLASPFERSDSNLISSNQAVDDRPSSAGPIEAEEYKAVAKPLDWVRWNAKYISELSSAVGLERQPSLSEFYKVSELSGNLIGSRLLAQLQGVKPIPGLGSPWHYTSELPGIRPIHRSVKVGLALYNGSASLL